MKFSFLLLIALACGAAQAQQAPCLKLKQIMVEDHVLHQNGTTTVELIFEGHGCYLFVGSPVPAPPNWRPFIAEVEGAPGLMVESKGFGARRFDGAFVRVRAQEITETLTLTAIPGLEAGKHKLHGQIHYTVMDSLANTSEETLAFEVPIKVVPPKKIHAPGMPFEERHPVWAKILLPLEIIALFPLWVVAGLFYPSSC